MSSKLTTDQSHDRLEEDEKDDIVSMIRNVSSLFKDIETKKAPTRKVENDSPKLENEMKELVKLIAAHTKRPRPTTRWGMLPEAKRYGSADILLGSFRTLQIARTTSH